METNRETHKSTVLKSTVQILENKSVARDWYSMKFSKFDIDNKKVFGTARAGQFISLSLPHFAFRRPFAVSTEDETSFSILYQRQTLSYIPSLSLQKKENVTGLMSKMTAGDTVDIMGFHGNSFPLPKKDSTAILVAGGIGLGPLLFFSEYLHNYGQKHNVEEYINPILIIGARDAALIPQSLCEVSPAQIHIRTDDGSLGSKGTSLDEVQAILEKDKNREYTLYFCGPLPMMKNGAKLSSQKNILSYASLDMLMPCCMGACVSCVVPLYKQDTTNPDSIELRKSCIEGPIFDTKRIAWEQPNEY